ncbi:39803_t:CDS:2, partial [Gigaspora margarita]
SNYRDIIKIFVFVLDGLIDSNLKLNKTICSVFVKWNIMYLWTKHDELSDTNLIIFEKDIQEWHLNFIIDKNPWYSLKLYNINDIILQLEFDKLISQETIQGFKYIQHCIEDFLSNIKKDLLNLNIQFEVFKNVKLKYEIIIRALLSFYKAVKIENEEQQLFINDNEYCYAK